MGLLKMYSGLTNSPVTTIVSGIGPTDTTINISDPATMPDAPNILALGGDTDDPETIKLISINGTVLTVERAFQGVAQSWAAGTKVSRNFTEYDYAALKYNIEVLEARKTGTDVQARREILDIKLKLDEMNIVEYLNKTGIGFFDLFKDISNINTTNTTATVNTSNAEVDFIGNRVLRMKPEIFDNFSHLELAIYDKGREYIEVDNSIDNNKQIQITISIGDIVSGDRFYYNGEVYNVAGVQEV